MAYTALLGYSAAWFPDWPGLGSAIYAGCEAILLPYAWAFSPWTQYRGWKTLRLSGAEQSDDIVRATM